MLTHGIWVVIHPHTTFAKYFNELSKKNKKRQFQISHLSEPVMPHPGIEPGAQYLQGQCPTTGVLTTSKNPAQVWNRYFSLKLFPPQNLSLAQPDVSVALIIVAP